MKILMISPDLNYPPIYGGRIRRYNLTKYLSRDNDISLLAFTRSPADMENIKGIAPFCREVETVALEPAPPGGGRIREPLRRLLKLFSLRPEIVNVLRSNKMARKIRDMISANDYDLVLIEYWYMGQYADCCGDLVKVLDEVDVEFMRWEQWYKLTEDPAEKKRIRKLHRTVKRYELQVVKKFDKILAVTSKDKEFLEKHNPRLDMTVVPTCVDTGYFTPATHENSSRNLVFTGSMQAVFNIDAMLFFCKNFFPLLQKEIPEAKFFIVGLNPTPEVLRLGSDSITVTGTVDDVRPYVYDGSVYVAPLRFGSGIKGKILEAMALGRPVVTTSIGAQGLDVVSGRHLVVEDDPEKFAQKTVALLNDAQMRRALTENALEVINRAYTWEAVIPGLNQTLKELVNLRQ